MGSKGDKSENYFVSIPFSVARNPEIDPESRSVLMAICTHLPFAFPSIKLLTTYTGLCKATVGNRIKRLIQLGVLERQKWGRGYKYVIASPNSGHNSSAYGVGRSEKRPAYPMTTTSLPHRLPAAYGVGTKYIKNVDILSEEEKVEVAEAKKRIAEMSGRAFKSRIKKAP